MTTIPAHSQPARSSAVIDGGDLGCGELLMLVARQIRSMPAGSIIEIVTTDLAAPLDLPAWCHLTRHHYLGPSPQALSGHYLVELGERPAHLNPDRPWHVPVDDPSRPRSSQPRSSRPQENPS